MVSMASLVRVLFTAFFLLICMRATNARLLRNSEKDGAYEIAEKARTQARPPAIPVLKHRTIVNLVESPR
nr:hypothetical protein [Tanacetum cinerariifolium]